MNADLYEYYGIKAVPDDPDDESAKVLLDWMVRLPNEAYKRTNEVGMVVGMIVIDGGLDWFDHLFPCGTFHDS